MKFGRILQVLRSITFVLIAYFATARTGAQTLPTQMYVADFMTPNIICQLHLPNGALLVGTDGGVFFFNGVRFVQLGPPQGLPPTGIVFGLTLTTNGTIAAKYLSRIFTAQFDPARPNLTDLHFQALGKFKITPTERIAAFGDGIVTIDQWRLRHISFTPGSPPPTQPMLPGDEEVAAFHSHDDKLWAITFSNRFCHATLTRPFVCMPPPPARWNDEKWRTITVTGKLVYARSNHHFAVIDPRSETVAYSALPFTSQRYESIDRPPLFITGDGAALTPGDGGLMEWHAGVWRRFNFPTEALADDRIRSITETGKGTLWIGFFNSGEARVLGYRSVESWTKQDGLSNNSIWSMVRQPDGPLWIGTDTSLDTFSATRTPKIQRVFQEHADSLSLDKAGHIWFVASYQKLCRVENILTPIVCRTERGPDMALSQPNGPTWLITQTGLRKVVPGPDNTFSTIPVLTGTSAWASLDPLTDRFWMQIDTDLISVGAKGDVQRLNGFQNAEDAESTHYASIGLKTLWVVNASHLYRIQHEGMKVTHTATYSTQTLGLRSPFVSIKADTRHWLWVGTGEGVLVNNGHQWTHITTQDGLISNDVNEGSIEEDSDGSMWIGTSSGLSHLTNITNLFDTTPAAPFIEAVSLNGRKLTGPAPYYSRAPLDITFGTLDYAHSLPASFEYRLDGVDGAPIFTASDHVHYPYLPPGKHIFHLTTYDTHDGKRSNETTVTLTMPYPWWQRWPFIIVSGATVILTAYVAFRLRLRKILARQTELAALVDHQTRELQHAARELEYQASHDSLTGLLNRRTLGKSTDTLQRQRRRGEIIHIVAMDVDHFKSINDNLGHSAGDEVLAEIGRRFRLNLTENERAFRYGGEEFLFMLLADRKHAHQRAEELRHELTRERIVLTDGDHIQLTISAGCSSLADPRQLDEAIDQADQCLYRAKISGRDRLVMAGSDAR